MVAAETCAWKLALRSPLHVSEQGVGLEETVDYIPSDTLFSALVVTWLEMARHRTAVLQHLNTQPASAPLLLTSAFPYAGDVLLLPKPNLLLTPTARTSDKGSSASESGKKYKKVRWVSVAIFKQLVNGINQTGLDELWAEQVGDKDKVQGGMVWMTRAEKEQLKEVVKFDEENSLQLWGEQNTPKVTIDRVANASALFHVGRLHFAPNCGLWLMARGENEWLKRTEEALRLLADGGIGGQRSRGNGQFSLEHIADPDLTLNGAATEYDLLLSRLAPQQTEMALLRRKQASYQLVTVGGFNGTPGDTPIVRQQVRLLTEGSIIGHSPRPPGQLVNVNPFWDEDRQQLKAHIDRRNPQLPLIEHPIYRYGLGFTVPIQVAD